MKTLVLSTVALTPFAGSAFAAPAEDPARARIDAIDNGDHCRDHRGRQSKGSTVAADVVFAGKNDVKIRCVTVYRDGTLAD